ncbi:MAG: type II toxin-antitoxin system VapC family toxin [Patescibacteria group bacterium]
MTSAQVFLDVNALIYALDETSEQYTDAVNIIQKLLDNDVTLCTSHHVIAEVIHVARKISGTSATEVVREISKIPDLVLVEPDAVLAFAKRYAALSDKLRMGVNDALLLQLMIDAGIPQLLSYDKRLANRATSLGIKQVAR